MQAVKVQLSLHRRVNFIFYLFVSIEEKTSGQTEGSLVG